VSGGRRYTIPNAITLLRILLVPPFVIFLIQGRLRVALAVFAVAAISDFVDGFLARRLRQQSPIGTFLDPLADKLLAATAFVLLAWNRLIPEWLTVLVVSREVVILIGMVILNALDVRLQIAPSRIGKLNTALQLTTVCLALLASLGHLDARIPPLETLLPGLYVATAATTVVSGLQYVFRGLGLVSQGEEGER
jgi:cardiolipin synthase